MPQFSPGVVKTAKVTMHNPTINAFSYEGVILMGTGLTEVSRVPFSLNAGEEKVISFPVVMPTVLGTYPVYIGVFSGGVSIALYKATEDVVIANMVGFTITSINCPTPKYGGVAVVNDGTGKWVLCGRPGSYTFDTNVYPIVDLYFYIDEQRADGSFAGLLGKILFFGIAAKNGESYTMNFAAGTLNGYTCGIKETY